VDQNNKARKCYGRRRLVKVLEEISHKPLIEQKETLENEMKEWQKDEIQRDDIAIWGIKI
ncbi:MAG: serine/threonine protein kinase, partial [bacterium]|nr:serine/threonine protein kinase [bacterium]